MKKILLAFILLSLLKSGINQTLKEYYIYCEPTDFQHIYQNYSENIYIPIVIKHNNITIDNARMRIRDDGSRVHPKKSLKVKLDGETFEEEIITHNFNAEYEDKSYMQQYVASKLFELSGHQCFKTEHVRLYLNDEFLGLYLYVENMDEDFLASRNMDIHGNLYKAKIDGASLSIYDNVYYHWDKQTGDENHSDLIDFIDELNSVSDEEYYEFAQNVLDYQSMINMLAVNLLTRNYSTYYHNYFMFHDIHNTQKWIMLPWDLDKAYLYYQFTMNYQHTSRYWAPDNPIMERAIICDPIFQDIRNRVDDLYLSHFNDDYVSYLVDSLAPIIESSVTEDETDLIEDLADWQAKVLQSKTAFNNRYNHLLYQFDNYSRSFKAERTKLFYMQDQEITIKWHPTEDPNGLDISYTLYYGIHKNHDNEENIIIPNITDTSYTLPADLDIGRYYWKVMAETSSYRLDGFDNYNFFNILNDTPKIVINEINYKSAPWYESGDWIELYNNSDYQVDLSLWSFQDENDENIFYIPWGTSLNPGAYLVLANNSSLFSLCHPDVENYIGDFDFGLSRNGELIRLSDRQGFLIDYVHYDSKHPWPESPNGTGPTLELIDPALDNALAQSWRASANMYGTPDRDNNSEDSIEDINIQEIIIINISPNPIEDELTIELLISKSGFVNLSLYNATGMKISKLFHQYVEAGKHKISYNSSHLSRGLYFTRLIFNNKNSISSKLIKL